MRIGWNDIGRADQPGAYELADGRRVQVSAMDITRWLEHPDGVFNTFWYAGTFQRPALLTLTDFYRKPALAKAS